MSGNARPLIGISSCLVGEKVRYDGTHKRNDRLLAELGYFADLQPICPEMGIGLGVPRPPLQLMVTGNGHMRVCGVADPSLDVTDDLRAYAEGVLPVLELFDGYVFKARSPSCGVREVLRVHPDGQEDLLGSGYFANFVRERLPLLPLADEDMLADPQQMSAFESYVKAYSHRRRTRGQDG